MEKKIIGLKNKEYYSYYEQGSGDNVLLLVHGNLSSSSYFLPLIKKIPSNIRTIAVDLRGFGDSTYNNRFNRLKDLADDIKLFLDELKIKKVNIAGWSLGGGVAMEFAAHYPDMTEKLILINSTTHRGYPIFKKDDNMLSIMTEVYSSPEELAEDPILVKPLLNAINNNDNQFIKYIYDATIYTNKKPSDEDNELYINETLKQRNLIDADYALAALNMNDEDSLYSMGEGTIKCITAPVLHFWGDLDRTVPEYMVLDNINAIRSKSKYVKFDECGHSPIVDKLDELTKEILTFI